MATGRRRAVMNVPLWGAANRGFRSGGHLTRQRATGTGTSEEYLARRFGGRTGAGGQRAVPGMTPGAGLPLYGPLRRSEELLLGAVAGREEGAA
jgi:hypothetical protein